MSLCRVVIIEDHDLTRAAIKLSLVRTGKIEVLGDASTGLAGLQLVEAWRPTVVIVDVGLADLDGIEVTRRIKMRHSNCPRVLILTLRDNEETVLAAFAAGADSYCMKDADAATLTDAIQRTAEGNSWIDPAIAGIVLQQMRQPQAQLAGEAMLSDLATSDQTGALTDRELEVLQLIVDGLSNAAIAEQLYISVGTVKTHVRHILNKLCANDRTQAAVSALRSGLAH
ncbi:MAG: response regulator transcription factor [Thermosynechococcaceae cyanobacterium]